VLAVFTVTIKKAKQTIRQLGLEICKAIFGEIRINHSVDTKIHLLIKNNHSIGGSHPSINRLSFM
jgi:hypothetical protein